MRLLLVSAAALLVGCGLRTPPSQAPTPAEQLREAVSRAQAAASAGQPDEADAILARFADGNPSTPEAREARYWRAILGLESSASRADRDEARQHLDGYLADTADTGHMQEARLLRHLLAAVDSAVQATDSATTAARQAAAEREEALRKEIQTLKEELAKTNEELTRIKRRLGSRP
jgi:outer membrane protein assembly factor BamD (BamD/ComL family)